MLRSIPMRIARLFAQIILWFIGLSLLLVIAYKWVPVPVTATMLMDENGITKDWESLDNIDPNLVAAVIASEDSKFCEHFGPLDLRRGRGSKFVTEN